MKDGFDMSGIDELVKDLETIEKNLPKKSKSFIQKEGTKLKNKTKRMAKKKVKKESGTYLNRIQRGKPYLYEKDILSIRTYSTAPHAHLIEYGHIITHEKDGPRLGYVKGKHVFQNAINEFQPYYHKHCIKFVDEVFNDGGWR